MSKPQVLILAFAALLFAALSLCAQVSSPVSEPAAVQPADSGLPALPLAAAAPTWHPGTSDLIVRYENERLTVMARGATLNRVLEVIAQRTGTAIESTGIVDGSRVYVELGPATVQSVLTDLLNGLPANYAMLGSRTNPGFIERLIISPRTGAAYGSASQSSALAVPSSPPQPRLYGSGFAPNPEGSNTASTVASGLGEEDQQSPSTELAPVQHNIDPSIVRFQQAATAAAASGKSRAEILDELQKQQIQELDAQAAQSVPH